MTPPAEQQLAEAETAEAPKDGAATPYYVRKIDVGERYKALGDGGAASALSSVVGDDGRIHIGMEIDSLIRDVAPDLYGDWKAFVREDVNNALRQVREARSNGRRGAHVHVILDAVSRTVEVHDVGTEGMPVAVFRDVYTVLGRSGNLDGRESGQKGIGRFAYLGASDTKIVETYARDTSERYGFIIRGGKVFEPIPDEMLSIAEHGTRTSVCVDEGHNFDDLPEYARRVAAAQAVPVYLTTTGFRRNCTRQRIDGKGGRGCSCRDAVRIKTDDFEFVGCFRCQSLPNRRDKAVYLIGIPIEMHAHVELGAFFETTTLNVLDERKYEPITSRERLSDAAADRLAVAVDEALQAEIAKIECDPASVLRDAPPIVHMVAAQHGNSMLYEKDRYGRTPVNVLDVVSASVRAAALVLRSRYPVLIRTDPGAFDGGEVPRAKFAPGGGVADYYERNLITLASLKVIADALGDGQQVWYARGQSIKWRRAAWQYVEDGKGPVILLGGQDGEGWEGLERLGARPISSAPGTAAGAGGAIPGRAKVRYGTFSKLKRFDELGPNDICVPRDPGITRLLKVCVEMRKQDCHVERIGLFPWQSGAGESGAQTFDAMRAAVDSAAYETSAGPMSGRDILDMDPGRLAICPADDKYVAAVCDNRVAAGAVDDGVVAVYRGDDADDDRLWLAYGYENSGSVPGATDKDRLFKSAMRVLGVPAKAIAGLERFGNERMLVGHLRMLRTDAQRVAYLRLHGMISPGYHDDYSTVEGIEQAAIYLSETDPERDDIGLCMDIVRDMNASGELCSVSSDDMYYYDVGRSWRLSLMAIAINRLARAAMGRNLLRFDYSSLKACRVFGSADEAKRLIGGILGHLFGSGTDVRTFLDDEDVRIDVALCGSDSGDGDGNGPAARIGGALFSLLLGSAAMFTIECGGSRGGRLRVSGRVGSLAGGRVREGGGRDACSSKFDGCC